MYKGISFLLHLLFIFLLILPIKGTTTFNSSCIYHFGDKEVYDLKSLRVTSPKDYTYKENGLLYIVNFCGPTIKACNGITDNFASIWNTTTFECLETLAENNPEATYIKPNDPGKGIKITYKGNSITEIVIECDQAYDIANFLYVKTTQGSPNVYTFSFKSKQVCRNFAEPEPESMGWFSKFLIFLIIGAILYCVLGIAINYKTNRYQSFSESIPHKEFWLNLGLKSKSFYNSLFQGNTNSQSPQI